MWIYFAIGIAILIVMIGYSCLIIGGESDDRIERLWADYKANGKKENTQPTGETKGVGSDYSREKDVV